MVAGRWIAGADITDAVRSAKRFKNAGIGSIINYLGEDLTHKKDIAFTIDTYLRLIEEIKKEKLHSDISVKPTQLGLLVNRKTFHNNLGTVVNAAKKKGVFVWIDMEDNNVVEDTIDEYMAAAMPKDIGICIQAYLLDSGKQIKRIIKGKGTVRLVKGAYPLSDHTFKTRGEITRNYEKLMSYLFRKSKKFTIATHDSSLIEKAISLERKYGNEVTYAMLNGVRNRYLKNITERGHKTSVYIPFGEKWVDYSYRRLKEAGHASIILKSLFERQGV